MAKGMEKPVQRRMRASLRGLTPYQPIQRPSDSAVAAGRIIKLDGNENVYGCSPRVQKALRSHQAYHIYPDPEQRRLRRALEGYVSLDAKHILAGAGSDELIDLLLRLVLDPGDKVIDCVPTFGMYSFSTQLCGGQVTNVQRTPEYTVDITAVLQAVDPRTKVIFVASPNNPTGTATPREEILRLLQTDALVVVDEAYYEFSGSTVADLVPQHDNLVVLRTFSKWAGLAGLRVGYGIFPPDLVAHLMAIKPPYNINAAAEVAALESLKDLDYLMGTVRALVEERDRLHVMLSNILYLDPVPSEANFILCHVIERDARQIHQQLREKGILLRYFDTPLLQSAIRISVGKPEHTDAVIWELRAWEEMQ